VAFFGYFLSTWKESSLRPGAQHASPPEAKKETPRRKTIFTIPPAAAGDIYFVRADRPEIIKRKKKKGPAGKQSLLTPPPPGGGIIKGKKRKAQWAFLFFEFN